MLVVVPVWFIGSVAFFFVFLFFFFFFCLHYFVYRAVQDQMTVSKYAIGETLQLFLKCCGRFSIQVFLLGSSIIIHHKRRLT